MRPHTRRRVVVMMARAVVCVLIGAGIALATPKIAATNLDRPLTGWEPVPKAGIARAASSAFAFRRERRGFLGWHPIVDATDRARDEGQSLLPSAMGVVGPVGFDPTLIERLTYEGNRHFRPAIDRKDAIVVIIESIAVGWPFATHRAIAIAHARRGRVHLRPQPCRRTMPS